MIDDYAKAMELVRKMKAHLPIPARPTKTFIQAMRDSEIKSSDIAAAVAWLKKREWQEWY